MTTCPHAAITMDAAGLPEFDPHAPDFLNIAHAVYAAWRETSRTRRVRTTTDRSLSPAMPVARRSMQTVYVNSYDDVNAALTDDRLTIDLRTVTIPDEHAPQEDNASGGIRILSQSLIEMDPPEHTRVRKLVQPTFTPRTMEAMRPALQQTADALLDGAEAAAAARGEVAPNRRLDLIPQFAYPLPVAIISDLLGIPRERTNQWMGMTRRDESAAPPTPEEARERFQQFVDYLKELFEERRANPRDDMISRMALAMEGDDRLTDEEMLATAFLLYGAGHATTVNLIGNAVVALLTHPDELARLRRDPELIPNAIEETLRYWAPAETVGRSIMERDGKAIAEEVEVAECPLHSGELLTLNLAAANRDPARFTDPDTYNISRTNANRHIAFGKGIHLCLGAPLARVEGQLAIETLFRRFPDLRLAVPEAELSWSGGVLRGFQRIPLLF
ncbi:MAG: cytochrome P450 [Chloroflexota bacterium]|nr:cytochrome P450 [Chloroflexota bacterium]